MINGYMHLLSNTEKELDFDKEPGKVRLILQNLPFCLTGDPQSGGRQSLFSVFFLFSLCITGNSFKKQY